jgi:uncharacterized protein
MGTQHNIETVRGIYAAFGKGDVGAILAKISPDVEWEPGYGNDDVPWLRSGHGTAAAVRFFETLRGFDVKRFDVLSIAGEGDWVVGLVHIELTWRETGRTIVEPCEPHVWRFDKDGKVVMMRHAADTRQHARVAGV